MHPVTHFKQCHDCCMLASCNKIKPAFIDVLDTWGQWNWLQTHVYQLIKLLWQTAAYGIHPARHGATLALIWSCVCPPDESKSPIFILLPVLFFSPEKNMQSLAAKCSTVFSSELLTSSSWWQLWDWTKIMNRLTIFLWIDGPLTLYPVIWSIVNLKFLICAALSI